MKSSRKMTEIEAIMLAAEEAKKGIGRVEPNPPVGCVILDRQKRLIATGFHKFFGGNHAEIEALKKIKRVSQIKGAHLFVTLEPCAHYGKTPPCALFLSQLPLASVTYAVRDPNPLVSGKGHKIIAKAKIKIKKIRGDNSLFTKLAEKFLYAQKNRKSFVTLKVATSIDGQLALKNGESKWISSSSSRLYAHALRAEHSAILIGKNTLIKDNPKLNIRHPLFKTKKNKIIVLDPSGSLLRKIYKFNIYKYHNKENLIFVTSKHTRVFNKYCTQLRIGQKNGDLDLTKLKKELFKLGIQSLLVEGGAKTLSLFLKQKAADKLCLFLSPTVIGQKNAISWTSDFAIPKLNHKIILKDPSLDHIDNDFLLKGYF